MSEKKKLDEKQIWSMLMSIMPVVILMNAGKELTEDSGMQILYSGVFGGIGGLIGFSADFLTKDRNRLIKIFSFISLIFICGLTIYLLSSKQTDAEILEQQWITQKIGKIEFDAPTKLNLIKSDVPDSVKWFYSEMKIYSDEKKDRITTFTQTKILIDTLSIENAYASSLDAMLRKLNVSLEKTELEVFLSDEEEVSAMFTFNLNGEMVSGFGFMYLKGEILESIWLIPLKRGFSKEYIEVFKDGIYPDYE
jgi:hypothetical protein